MSFSRKRQRFLVNQGYAYKVVTKLAGSEKDKELLYESREHQVGFIIIRGEPPQTPWANGGKAHPPGRPSPQHGRPCGISASG